MPKIYRKKGRHQKRWYFDATIGKNVPVVGGTSLRLGTGNQKRSLQSVIKNVVRRQILEPKMHRSGLQQKASVLHNTIYGYNIMRDIGVGTDEEARLADCVYVKKFLAKFELFGPSAGTVQQVSYRVMLIKSKVADATAQWWSSPLGSSDIFWGSNSNLKIAPINFNQCTALYDKVINMQSQSSTGRISREVNLSVSLKKFRYDETNSTLGKFYNYYLIVIPFIQGGTTGTTVVGDFDSSHCTSFIDSK